MSEKNFILTTSGFILPKTQYYTHVENNDQVENIIFNRVIASADSTSLKDFFVENSIYSSSEANTYLKEYLNNESFENYLRLINFTATIFEDLDLILFFKLQAQNKFLSKTSFDFCVFLLENYNRYNYDELHTVFHYYFTLPYSLRFQLKNDHLEIEKRMVKMDKLLSNPFVVKSMPVLLANLATTPEAFSSFFRYLFTDQYNQ